MVQQAGRPHRMSRELAWCVSITINSNSNYKLTQKIIAVLWLNLFYFSAFLLGFQELGADISFSFRQRLARTMFSIGLTQTESLSMYEIKLHSPRPDEVLQIGGLFHQSQFPYCSRYEVRRVQTIFQINLEIFILLKIY